MLWNREQKLAHLMSLAWTIVPEVAPEGDRLLRVRELPSAVGCGTSQGTQEEQDDTLVTDFWESFEAALGAYLDFGDDDKIPLPAGACLPWSASALGAMAAEPAVPTQQKVARRPSSAGGSTKLDTPIATRAITQWKQDTKQSSSGGLVRA